MSLFLKHITLYLKKTTRNILYSWQFSAQTAHLFPYSTLNSTVNNVLAVTVNMSMSATLNDLKMTKKLSPKPKNQYIVLFNLLIIRSSVRTKSLRCYMTCWGNLSNYTEILKCCGWKLIPELYVTGSPEDCFFPNSISPTMQGLCFICWNHWVADTMSRYLLYNAQWPAQHERLINIFQMKIPSIHMSNRSIVS